MTSLEWRLKTLVFCFIATIAVASYAANRAQALPGWMIPASEEPGPGVVVEVEAKAEKALVLLSKSGATPIQISCEKLVLDKGLLEAEGKSSGTVLASSCQFLANGKVIAVCKPAEPITAKVKGQLLLHEGVAYDRFEPVEGKTFTTVKLGPECAFGEEVEVSGVFYAKDNSGKLEAQEEAHTLVEGSLTALKYGGNAATIDGSVSLSLKGEHLNARWNGLGA